MTEPTTWTIERIVRVTDGDTVRAIRSRPISLDGRHYRLTDDDPRGVALRLAWVDTPERGQAGYTQAREDLWAWIGAHPQAVAHCYESAGWDRIIADIRDAQTGESASQWLMGERGWAAYEGKSA